MGSGLWWWHGGAGTGCATPRLCSVRLCREEGWGRAGQFLGETMQWVLRVIGFVLLLPLVPWVSPNTPCEGLERCHPGLHSASHRIHTAAA